MSILRELLPNETDDEKLRLTAFSIVGQCLFYHFADPVIRNLLNADEYAALDVDKLAEHIARFSLRSSKARDKPTAPLTPPQGEGIERERSDELDRAQDADGQPRQIPGNHPWALHSRRY